MSVAASATPSGGSPSPDQAASGGTAASERRSRKARAAAVSGAVSSGAAARLSQPERLRVPGVELAQVATRALDSQVLLGAVDDPAQLGDHLVARGLALAQAEQALEPPRVAQRAAREHHGVGAGALEGLHRALVGAQAAGDDHRHVERLDQLRGQHVVRLAAVLLRGVARVEGDAGHARLVDQPPRQLEAGALARALPGAQLDRHGQSAALARRAGDRDRAVGIVQQGGPGARLAHLADGAAHVEVDQVGAVLGGDAGGDPHDVGVVPEQLDGHRVLVRVDAQELAQRALVAVLQPEARDHLAERQPGAVPLGLEPHEPVADAGQRREHHAVGDPVAAQGPGLVQGAHGSQVSPGCAPRSGAGPSASAGRRSRRSDRRRA